MATSYRFFAITLVAKIATSSADLPNWGMPVLDPLKIPYGGAPVLQNASWARLYFGTADVGLNAMSPMLSFLNGAFLATWKLSQNGEDSPGQKVMFAQSADGKSWTPSASGDNVMFPSMNSSENPGVALFAEPTLYLNGRVYAAASPKQFCLYPTPFAPLLLLRRVFDGVNGSFGQIFWAGGSIPPGFAQASASQNVTVVGDMDSQTQADVALLTPNATILPCAESGTTKCEACAGGCQVHDLSLSLSCTLAFASPTPPHPLLLLFPALVCRIQCISLH